MSKWRGKGKWIKSNGWRGWVSNWCRVIMWVVEGSPSITPHTHTLDKSSDTFWLEFLFDRCFSSRVLISLFNYCILDTAQNTLKSSLLSFNMLKYAPIFFFKLVVLELFQSIFQPSGIKRQEDELTGAQGTPPLKVGARPRSDSMETEKAIFICYQGNHHAIYLIWFLWKIIEF